MSTTDVQVLGELECARRLRIDEPYSACASCGTALRTGDLVVDVAHEDVICGLTCEVQALERAAEDAELESWLERMARDGETRPREPKHHNPTE